MRRSYQRCVIHAKHNDSLVLRAVLTPSSDMGLDNISTVQERHLSVLLDPHLVSRMGRNHIQCGDMDSELAGLGELANADA